LDPAAAAAAVTAEDWEGGRISARTPVSASDVHHIFFSLSTQEIL
jgi:hypothetical protein